MLILHFLLEAGLFLVLLDRECVCVGGVVSEVSPALLTTVAFILQEITKVCLL